MDENNKILKDIRNVLWKIEFLFWFFGIFFTLGVINPELPIGFNNTIVWCFRYGLLWAYELGRFLSN